MTISERARKVLSQVVTLHYQTCEPVGSALISKTRVLSVSPATIRNIMMGLENSGYLHQPHISAGRLPTDLGYRTYVNDISLQDQPMGETEEQRLGEAIDNLPVGPAFLEAIANYIHKKTHLVSFHIPFRQSGLKLKHIHFERINPDRLLVLMVANGGYTHQLSLDIPATEMTPTLTEKIASFMNRAYYNHSISEIERDLTLNAKRGLDRYDLLTAKVATISRSLNRELSRFGELKFQGFSTLLQMPEFQDMNSVRSIFKLMEEQSVIKRVIRDALGDEDARWLLIMIGTEMAAPELEPLTLILSRFKSHDEWMGCVGVLGPKRLPYLRTLQILSFARNRLARRA